MRSLSAQLFHLLCCVCTGKLEVRRIGRYEVVTHPNTAVPDVIVHAAADSRPTSVDFRPAPDAAGSSGDHVTADRVTPPTRSADGVDRRLPDAAAVDGDDRKLYTSGGSVVGSSSSLPQLSLVSGGGRQQATLEKTGSNNLSLSALHASTHVDATSQRQTLIRSRACRPCHDLSKVTAVGDRPRFGSHFRLSAAVADSAATGGAELALMTPDDCDRSALLQNIVVCDPPHRDTQCPPGNILPCNIPPCSSKYISKKTNPSAIQAVLLHLDPQTSAPSVPSRQCSILKILSKEYNTSKNTPSTLTKLLHPSPRSTLFSDQNPARPLDITLRNTSSAIQAMSIPKRLRVMDRCRRPGNSQFSEVWFSSPKRSSCPPDPTRCHPL